MELTTPFNTTTIHGLAEYHQYMHRRSVQLVRTNNRVSQRSREMAIMGLLDEAHEWYREMREKYPREHRRCVVCAQLVEDGDAWYCRRHHDVDLERYEMRSAQW